MVNRPLFPEVAEAESTGLDEWGYWRMPKDHPDRPGWIVLSKMHAQQFNSNVRHKRMEPLVQYGSFTRDRNGQDVRGVPTNTTEEGWRYIFQQNGAHEFPPSQVFAYMWHEDPPYQGVDFPQIEGLDVKTFYCEECGQVRTVDVMALRSHLVLKHDYRREDLTRYGKDFGIEFSRRGILQQQKALHGNMQAVPDLQPNVQDDGRLRCTLSSDCNYVVPKNRKNPQQALEMHQRNAKIHKVAAEEAVPS